MPTPPACPTARRFHTLCLNHCGSYSAHTPAHSQACALLLPRLECFMHPQKTLLTRSSLSSKGSPKFSPISSSSRGISLSSGFPLYAAQTSVRDLPSSMPSVNWLGACPVPAAYHSTLLLPPSPHPTPHTHPMPSTSSATHGSLCVWNSSSGF